MKNIITLLFALVAFTINAQTDSTINKIDSTSNKVDTAESTEIDFGNVKIIIKDKSKKTITKDKNLEKTLEDAKEKKEKEFPRTSFETTFGIGVGGLQELAIVDGSSDGTSVTMFDPTSTAYLKMDYGQSRNYKINGNLMFDIHKNFGILTGLAVDFNRYVFKENVRITPNEGYLLVDSAISYGSYKFKSNYLEIPLMIVLKSNNQKFKFAFGGAFGYNIGSKVKQEYTLDNVEYKSTIKGNYNVAPIKMTLGARVAYKGIGLYFNYGMTHMFDNHLTYPTSQSNANAFSAGITFGGL